MYLLYITVTILHWCYNSYQNYPGCVIEHTLLSQTILLTAQVWEIFTFQMWFQCTDIAPLLSIFSHDNRNHKTFFQQDSKGKDFQSADQVDVKYYCHLGEQSSQNLNMGQTSHILFLFNFMCIHCILLDPVCQLDILAHDHYPFCMFSI